jgi:hypothetical protein
VAVNGSTGSGTAMTTVAGNTLEFTLAANGLADGPHAAHIHFGADARHECPVASDDADGDTRLSTTEGGPAYGPIVVSLTRSGDTSAKSGLAVDRFAAGTEIQYMRGGVTVEPGTGRRGRCRAADVVAARVEPHDRLRAEEQRLCRRGSHRTTRARARSPPRTAARSSVGGRRTPGR